MGTTLQGEVEIEHTSEPPSTREAAPARPRAGEPGPADAAERRGRFEREALAHLDALYSFARKLTRNRHDAEDLVSEAVLRAFDHWEQYELGTNARAWLFTILYRAFVSRRRHVERREVALPEDTDGRPAFEVVGEPDPEGKFYDSFLDQEVTRAIDELPADQRAAVVLGDVHGLRYAEIAQVLGIPVGTVKSRLFRGRRLLRQKLMRYALDMGYLAANRDRVAIPRPTSDASAGHTRGRQSVQHGGTARDRSARMDARTNQLRPTKFVDAVPELAAERTPPGQTAATEVPRSVEDEPERDGEEAEPLDPAA